MPFIKQANNGSLNGQHWQQDGASAHRTRKNLDYLQAKFGTRTLALGSAAWGGQEWSPNSPDLAPLDFCVWAVMKVACYIFFNVNLCNLIIDAETCLCSPYARK